MYHWPYVDFLVNQYNIVVRKCLRYNVLCHTYLCVYIYALWLCLEDAHTSGYDIHCTSLAWCIYIYRAYFNQAYTSIYCDIFYTGQTPAIFPTNTVEGQVGETISLACQSNIIAASNILQIYLPANDAFVSVDNTRSNRTDEPEPGLFTNYTFGPLRSSDNGTILRCISGGTSTANLTINVVCKWYINL